MKKTLLIGNFGSENIGDELILNFALEKFAKKELIVMTHDDFFSQKFTETTFDSVRFFPTGIRSFFFFVFLGKGRKEILSLQREVGEVVFCGGGLFAIKFRAVILWWFVFLWVRFLFRGVKIRFEYQGVDKHLNFLGRFLSKQVFARADYVSVRDVASGEALRAMGIDQYEVTKDMVHLGLKSLKCNDSVNKKSKIILLNSLSVFSESKWKSLQSKFSSYEFKYVCFDSKDRDFAPVGISVIFPKTKKEVFDLFSAAELCFGERLHFLIVGHAFCGADKTFMLNEPYAEKVESFCRQEGIKVLRFE